MAFLRRLARKLEQRKAKSQLRQLAENAEAGSALIDFSSNDYLGLASNRSLHRIFVDRCSRSDARLFGPPSSRLLDGNSARHLELESNLARFFNGDAALLFNSGFDANVGLWSCLPGEEDVIVYDELCHASTHDGMRQSKAANRLPFKHNSVQDLRRILSHIKAERTSIREGNATIFIALEALYSMDGDLVPLHEMVLLVDTMFPLGNAQIVLDEAHSTGLYGQNGRGLASALGVDQRIPIRLHTFGKAMACSGAVVICNPIVRSFLINYARPLIYSTVMPSLNVMAIQSSLEMLQSSQQASIAAKLHSISQQVTSELSTFLPQPNLHLPLLEVFSDQNPSTTPIIPLLTAKPRDLSLHLRKSGFIVRPITFPTVPKGQERVRICVHASNTPEQVTALVRSIKSWVEKQDQVEKLVMARL